MASSSGNSSGSAQLQNYASEGDLHRPVDQRKRKRMQSNRESARRSRMRKQQHLDDLMAQVAQLRKENNQILTSINITTQHFMNVESENSVLKAQMGELSQRLESLDEILGYINGGGGHGGGLETTPVADQNSFINPWNMLHVNQPIMATADMLHQYY